MNKTISKHLKTARDESLKSDMREKVGAVLVVGKTVFKGRNKKKTHPKFANPNKHKRISLHAELDCLIKATNDQFPSVLSTNGTLYVFRQTAEGKPAMARPCEQCMEFIKRSDIATIIYTMSEFPYIKEEKIK